MKILLTGGRGFIGSHLKPAFEGLGFEVVAPSERHLDLRDGEAVIAWVKQAQPQIVVHLAARTEVALSFDNYADFQDVNYLGTVRLAEACMRHVPDFRQFVFASTMETYGFQESWVPFTEQTPQCPMAPYAVAKFACERYLEYMRRAYVFPSTIIRQTNAYGRTNSDFFVMERIITQMLDGDCVRLGDPNPIRNFLFIDDLVSLYRTLVNNSAAIGKTYVTGPNNALPIRALATLCGELLQWSGTIEWYTIPHRPGEIYYLNSTSKKASAELGWRPKVRLYDGIIMTAERIRAARKAQAA